MSDKPWPQPGTHVQLKHDGMWCGRGTVIGPGSEQTLGDTDIPARWNIRIDYLPGHTPGSIINYHYLDILGYPPTPPAAAAPIRLVIKEGQIGRAGEIIGELLPQLEPGSFNGILIIPVEATR